ncbi:MAG: hypothetical protein AAAB16_02170 [Pseudomonas sp.]|uniref:hypothetical protein n=1 Tax=Pseudomonas sp. TaxID=306 RepID=UPI0030F24CAA
MPSLKKHFSVKFYLTEISTGGIVGALIFLSLNIDIDEFEARSIHNTLYLSCGSMAAIGFFLHEKDTPWIEHTGLIFTKIALNIFGALLVLH